MERVSLGMPGPWADSNYEAADIYTSKVGGVPDWPLPITDEKLGNLECSSCSNKLSLLAQIYAPISSESLATKDRVIYVLCCLVPECESLSWRALRVQKNSTSEALHVLSPPCSSNNMQNGLLSFDIGQELDDDEEEDDIDLDDLANAFSEAANISSTTKKQTNVVESTEKHHNVGKQARPVDDKLPVMPCFYLWTQEEKQLKNDTLNSSTKTMPSDHGCSEHNSDDEKYEAESYEYDRTLHADRTYLKFKKRLDANPEQCFRYSHGGKPLVASGNLEDPGICSLCGDARHYEMQLMPPLIYFLQEEADHQQRAYTEKLDWTTLIIYTCSKSCGSSSAAVQWTVSEEAVIVQHD